MTLPADSPKLPLWPFLIGDAALLGLAWLIADQSRNPFTGPPLVAIVVCVGLGALLCIYPIIVNDVRRQEESLDERQRALDALSRTVATSAEQISIAANGLHEISELAHRNLKAAEHLPHKLQDKIAVFQAQLDNANEAERDELEKEVATLRAAEGERLESAADKVAKSVAELTRLETAAQKHLAASTEALAKVTATLASHEAKAAASTERSRKVAAPVHEPVPIPAESIPEVAPVAPPEAVPVPASGAAAKGEPALAENHPPTSAPARKRAPKKAPPSTPATAEPGLPSATLELKITDPPAAPPAADGEIVTGPSPDGATRLLVTAYIGIGNRLFIRGAGPGLSWDKGVPLQFVSIGKWRWETTDATAPVQFKLYKNDDLECAALGSRTIEAGQQQEVTAAF